MKRILTSLSFALLLIVLLLNVSGGDLTAKAASDLYPLPAPIIEVFPDDGLAKDMASNLNKDSVNDVIDQDDLDALTSLAFETTTITNDSMKLLERAMFNNVEEVYIEQFGKDFTEFPDITTIPHLTSIYFAVPRPGVTGSVTLPDYQNYPEMDSITLSNYTLIGSIPDFTGMPKLRHLNLYGMSITSDIPDFHNIPQLLTLNLGDNEIEEVPDFHNIPQLLELYLNINKIEEVPDFHNIPQLLELDLSANELTDTMTNFTNLPHLNDLNLDFNHLYELPSNVLDAVFVLNQTGYIANQTINQGESCTIELPIYFQMEEIGMLANPAVSASYLSNTPTTTETLPIPHDETHIPVTVDEATKTMTLDTTTISPGVYNASVQYNMAYPVTVEGCAFGLVLTVE